MRNTTLDMIRSWQWGREYFRFVRPAVVASLQTFREAAEHIPEPSLREQALSSITTKQFHCEGGGVFGGPSRDAHGAILEFLVPYQTLCDYLDTVTDRGPSQDPTNLRWLHQSLIDAVTPDAPLQNYYAHHPYQDDGGYIHRLVRDSQHALTRFTGYSAIQDTMLYLVSLYVDLQVYKHGPQSTRETELVNWFQRHSNTTWDLYWWEFAAAAGSTLGLFALLELAIDRTPSDSQVVTFRDVYFPWIGSLHILLDYLIDQVEDREGGDLNFVSYYRDEKESIARIKWIYHQSVAHAQHLPDSAFHRYVVRGLLGFYLSDQKVRRDLVRPAFSLLFAGGGISIGVWLAARIGRAP